MKKRILSFLLALLMVVSIMPMPTYAEGSADVTITPTETPTEAASEAPSETTTATEIACPTCGTVGCTSEHLNWCADCQMDDCGQNHCDTCGAIDCTTEHKTCDKCGTLDCTADHTNWCADCKVDNCGKTHVFCDICQKNDCGVDHTASQPCGTCGSTECDGTHENWCADCKVDNCGKTHVFCEICQKNDCGQNHCPTCGQNDCVSDHLTWCANCKMDDCGKDHTDPALCESCGEAMAEGHTCPTEAAEDADAPSEPAGDSAEPGLVAVLLAAESVGEMDALLLAAIENDLDSVLALTYEEIEALFDRVKTLDEAGYAAWLAGESVSEELESLLSNLSALPNGTCPDCGTTGGHSETCPRTEGGVYAYNSGTIPFSADTTIDSAVTVAKGAAAEWILKDGATVTIEGAITVNGTLTITGNGTLMRGPSYKDHLITVSSGGTLIINGGSDNQIIIDGNNDWTFPTNYGDKPISNGTVANYKEALLAITSNGKATLTNVTLQNAMNAGKTSRGENPGIFIWDYNGAELTMTNCTIRKMFASYGGAAVFLTSPKSNTADSAKVTLKNCTIKECMVWTAGAGGDTSVAAITSDGNDGGMIRTFGMTKCEMTISGGSITNNWSSGRGGGIFWNAGRGFLTLNDNVEISGNRAGTYGGGIMAMTKIELNSANITQNTASSGGGLAFCPTTTSSQKSSYSSGGQVYEQIRNPSMTLNGNVTIEGNTANEKGGGLFIEVGDAQFSGGDETAALTMELNIDGATIQSNTADNGGGIHMVKGTVTTKSGTSAKLAFNSGTLSGNTATTDGGGVYLAGIPVSIGTDSGGPMIQNNTAQSGSGGGFYIDNTQKLPSITGEMAVQVTNATVSGNKAESGNGGGIYLTGSDTVVSSINLSANTISENRAQNGGAICVNGGSLAMNSGYASGNEATNDGGAIYIDGGNFTMPSGSLTNNTAGNRGGAVAIGKGNAVIGLEACKGSGEVVNHTCPEIKENTAANNGGGISVSGGTTTMYCGSVVENQCTNDQTSDIYYQDDGTFTIYGGELGTGIDMAGGTFNDEREGVYLITFATTNESGDEISQTQEIRTGSLTFPGEDTLPDFAQSGKVLFGWTTNKASTILNSYQVGTSAPITSSTVFHAVYVNESYNINYDLDGGTNADANPQTYSVSMLDGKIALKAPTKESYSFLGWSIIASTGDTGNWTAESGVQNTLVSTGKFGDLTLKAEWGELDFTITYEGVDGAINTNPNGFKSGDLSLTLADPTKTGYVFLGWTGTNGNTPEKGLVIKEYRDDNTYAYTANWEVIEYTITLFDEQTSTMNYNIEKEFILPKLEKTGYVFKGWRSETTSGSWRANNIYTADTNWTGMHGNVSLTAEWELVTADVTVEVNGLSDGATAVLVFSGKPESDLPEINLRLAFTGNGSVTIHDLPVGKYSVTVEDNEWAWRLTTTGSGEKDTKTEQHFVVSFTSNGKNRWLNGYGAN